MNEISMVQIKAMLADEGTRAQALDRMGEWAKDTCLMAGSEATTAYKVASTLVSGISEVYEGAPAGKGWWRKKDKVIA
jgi:hypothetical protein